MKLNHECVRDLMLFVESDLAYGTFANINRISLPPYSSEELVYTADKLLEAKLFNGKKDKYTDSFVPEIHIYSLTWEGHQFLDNIRDNKVWKETKTIAKCFSSVSVGMLSNIAAQVITLIIQKNLSLT